VLSNSLPSYGRKGTTNFLRTKGGLRLSDTVALYAKRLGSPMIFPDPLKAAPPAFTLHSNMRRLLWITSTPLPWKKYRKMLREQIREVLTALQTNGYVLCDLRRPTNSFSTKMRRSTLIDFNWSGRYRHRKIQNNLVGRATGANRWDMAGLRSETRPSTLSVGDVHDTGYVGPRNDSSHTDSTQHDRMMVDKLPY